MLYCFNNLNNCHVNNNGSMNYFNQESDRLKYRKLTIADIPKWVCFFENNSRLKYLGVDLTLEHKTLANNWIHKQLERYGNTGFGQLAVELKTTGELIGLGGFIKRDLLDKEEIEISYSIMPKYWGLGYATELAQTMMSFGIKTDLADRFISIIDENNVASEKVALKNGMQILFKTTYLGMNVNVYGTS